MRSRTATWYECKVRYEKVSEGGLIRKVTEQYVVNALSFTEAEERITREMSQFISGVFEIKDIKPAPYKEVFFMNDGEKFLADETQKMCRAFNVGKAKEQYEKPMNFNPHEIDSRFYKAKLQFITIDEKSEKEKRSNVTYLVQACSLHNALDNIDSVMQGTMIDYVQANVGETMIVDVFE